MNVALPCPLVIASEAVIGVDHLYVNIHAVHVYALRRCVHEYILANSRISSIVCPIAEPLKRLLENLLRKQRTNAVGNSKPINAANLAFCIASRQGDHRSLYE